MWRGSVGIGSHFVGLLVHRRRQKLGIDHVRICLYDRNYSWSCVRRNGSKSRVEMVWKYLKLSL